MALRAASSSLGGSAVLTASRQHSRTGADPSRTQERSHRALTAWPPWRTATISATRGDHAANMQVTSQSISCTHMLLDQKLLVTCIPCFGSSFKASLIFPTRSPCVTARQDCNGLQCIVRLAECTLQ